MIAELANGIIDNPILVKQLKGMIDANVSKMTEAEIIEKLNGIRQFCDRVQYGD